MKFGVYRPPWIYVITIADRAQILNSRHIVFVVLDPAWKSGVPDESQR